MLAPRFRGFALAATLAVVAAPPAMPWVMAGCATESMAAMYHGHHGPAAPHHMAGTDCCDVCLSVCSPNFDVPPVGIVMPLETRGTAVHAVVAVEPRPVPSPQLRLPFPVGPPTLRSA